MVQPVLDWSVRRMMRNHAILQPSTNPGPSPAASRAAVGLNVRGLEECGIARFRRGALAAALKDGLLASRAWVGGPGLGQEGSWGDAASQKASSSVLSRLRSFSDGEGGEGGRRIFGIKFGRVKGGLRRVMFACGVPLAAISVAAFAGSGAASWAQAAGAHVDLAVLRASCGSSLNLISLCSFVVWLQASGHLPAETPTVLSQVAFRLLIPCFLMSKVSLTLASQPIKGLVALPIMALVQVVSGAILGKLACRTMYRAPRPQPVGAHITASMVPNVGGRKGDSVLTTVHAVPAAQVDLVAAANAAKRESLITAGCAFNNSLTLPLVFLSGVLSPENSSRAAGYLALYMVSWSPCLWTIGYRIIAGDEGKPSADPAQPPSHWTRLLRLISRIMNPPLYGVIFGILFGATPLSHLIHPMQHVVSSTTLEGWLDIRGATAGILRPVFDAVTLLGSATLAVQTIVLASSLAASVKSSGKAFKITLGQEAQELEASTPEPLLDKKAFWIIAVVRLILLPAAGLATVHALVQAKAIPSDPIIMLTILVEAAMPTAQNLVLLAQLRPSTRPLAGLLADLLLRQYALSIVPITLWMALFLSYIPPT